MILLGEFQELEIKRLTTVGAYINEQEPQDEDILLPKKYLTEEMTEGSIVNVFVYKDSEDRFVATTQTPMIKMGEFKKLTVKDVSKNGAYLNWGLEKDLFLPYAEQTRRLYKDDVVMVTIYVDKSRRISSTMNLYRYLNLNPELEVGAWVKGFIYDIKEEMGIFVAIEGNYNGIIPLKEIHDDYEYGQELDLRVVKLRDDGKVLVSPRKAALEAMDEDSAKILSLLEEMDGELALSDKSEPDEIKAILAMSKKAFKRAIGRLYKEQKIMILEDRIVTITGDNDSENE